MKLGTPFYAVCVVLTAAITRPAGAAVDDPAFMETPVVTGLKGGVTSMAWAPDGSQRLFVLLKTGQVRIVEAGQLLEPAFATLSPITTTGECGLLGVAFDPSFLLNGYVYFFVTVSSTEQQIVRYTAVGNTGTEKTVIVSGLPTQGENHDGGALGFGPDGKLYWAIGDNGGVRYGVGADLVSLASKVGRANADGSVPKDNPFYDGDGPNNDYIWARGFRNPFALAFQPDTGRLWLSVAGWRMEQVFTPQAGDHGGWDDYEASQPLGYIPPVISYFTDKAPAIVIHASGAVRSAGVTTITTHRPHPLRPGAKVTLAGVGDSSFDGPTIVESVTRDARTFSFAQAGPDASSGGGTATPELIGGAVTGGEFWDSSAVPAAYRGDFFFGDFNSGAIMRAQLASGTDIERVDQWGSGITTIVDMALGPDGDMYYVSNAGSLFRASYGFTAQALIVSRQNVRLLEAGKAAFAVRLATQPAKNQRVTSAWLSGDGDLTVVEGASLTFTPSNWATPQRVVIAAGDDPDSVDDQASIRVASTGLAAEIVKAWAIDDETNSLVVEPSALSFEEGDSEDLAVSLTQMPTGPLEVTVSRSGGDDTITVSGGTLQFDSGNWNTPQLVTVSAGEDADAEAEVATLTVSGMGLTSREVPVSVADNDEHAPVVTSMPVMSAVVGSPYVYDVEADALPEPVFTLDAAPVGMTIDPNSGVIDWTPSDELDVSVTVRVSNGLDPDAVQTFDIDVNPDAPPACEISAPLEGAAIAGQDGEFFGDVEDDVGAVRAEFLVDGAIAYEDVNDEGHYHFGGGHALFDTTAISDGEHVLTMRGYDTSGQTCSAEVTVLVANGSVDPNAGGAGGQPAVSDGGAPDRANAGAGGRGAGAEAGAPTLGDSGAPADAGAGTTENEPAQSDGCACRNAVGTSNYGSAGGLLLAALGAWRRRRAKR